MSFSFYMILDMLVAMADLGYGGPWLWWTQTGLPGILMNGDRVSSVN